MNAIVLDLGHMHGTVYVVPLVLLLMVVVFGRGWRHMSLPKARGHGRTMLFGGILA